MKTSPLEFKGFTLKEKMSNGTAENLEDGDTTDNVEDDPTTTLNMIRTATGITKDDLETHNKRHDQRMREVWQLWKNHSNGGWEEKGQTRIRIN